MSRDVGDRAPGRKAVHPPASGVDTPRFWAQASTIARRDLIVEGRSGEALLVTIPFGLAALFMIPLALPLDRPLLAVIGPGMYWVVTLLFGMFVTFRQTASEGTPQREMLTLLGVDPTARFVGRVAASALLLLVLQLVLAPAMVVLYAPEAVDGWPRLAVVALLAGIGLALVGTLVGDVTAGLRTRTTLAPLLVAPLSVPLLVPAAQAANSLRRDGSILVPVLLMTFTVLGLSVAGIVTARPLEETSR